MHKSRTSSIQSGIAASNHESPVHFVSILERISDGFFALDLDWRFTYVNAAAAALVRKSREELVGQVCWEVFPESAGSVFEREFRRAMTTGIGVELEEFYPPAESWLQVSVCPVRDGLTLYARNATPRRRAQENLRFQAALLDAVGEAVIATDGSGRIEFWNAAAQLLYGWTSAEAVGRPLVDVTPTARSREATANVLDDVAHGDRWTGEIEQQRKAGQVFHALLAIDALYDSSGAVRGAVSVCTDVSERRRAEVELRRQALVFSTISDAVVAIDLDGHVVDWNPAATRLFGYSKEEMLGREMVEVHDPPIRGELDRTVRETLARDGRWAGEVPFRRKDGTTGLSEVEIVAHHDAAGVPIGYIGVNRDITERRRLEQQHRQSQKMEAVGQLAGGIAHDFNNLLTIITTYAEFLLDELDDATEQHQYAVEVQAASRRAAALTQQLLAFSRHQLLQPRVLDLNLVVSGIEPMMRRTIGEDVRIDTRLAPMLWSTLADPGQIEQVLVNLAVNARDAMPNGGTITIETANVTVDNDVDRSESPLGPRDWVRLIVRDGGIGMDEATRARAFDPFFTTKGPGKGTGLGLATVYGIVKQSSGTISVESAPGQGASFIIHLPRCESAESVRPTIAATQKGGGSEVVLLVEDESAVRDLARRVLERNGYVILEAPNGREALRVAEMHEGHIHLLITDMVMPHLGGAEVYRALHPLRPTMRVLYMSGYTEDDIIRRGMFEPGMASLRKPFTPRELATEVRRVLDE